jgi:prepilin-type N-terminal cleavage/methylation domain-containing protein
MWLGKRMRAERAFTLIELLAVILVIRILAAIPMPTVGKAVNDAKKLTASRNLQHIVEAPVSFSLKDRLRELNSCQNAAEWAGLLAKYEELNAASLFFLGDDYLVETNRRSIPKTIGIMRNGQWHINPDFEKIPLSGGVIARIFRRASATTTPIADSRGLDHKTGQWRPANGDNGGICGGSGGFIVFLDGHVEFY